MTAMTIYDEVGNKIGEAVRLSSGSMSGQPVWDRAPGRKLYRVYYDDGQVCDVCYDDTMTMDARSQVERQAIDAVLLIEEIDWGHRWTSRSTTSLSSMYRVGGEEGED